MAKKILFIILIMMQTLLETSAQNSFVMNDQFANSENLKILSWNIYMLPYLSLFNGNTKRAHIIANKLENSDYQIIVFQEAFSSVCRGIISKRLKKNYPYQYGPVNKKHLPFKTNSGLWIASKIPLNELEQIQFSQSKSYDAVARKGAVIFSGKYKDTYFQLITTHLQAEDMPEIRKHQILDIKEKLLNKYYSPYIPQIICGDFNIDMEDEYQYSYLLQTLDVVNGEVKGDKTTYDEVYNTLSQERTGKRRTIDYIFVRNPRWIKGIERKVNIFYESNKKYIGNLSDHYALEAVVELYLNSKVNIAMYN